jgi:hypothetical protein
MAYPHSLNSQNVSSGNKNKVVWTAVILPFSFAVLVVLGIAQWNKIREENRRDELLSDMPTISMPTPVPMLDVTPIYSIP